MNISWTVFSTDNSKDFCQTTPEFGGSIVPAFSGLWLTVPTWRHGISSLEIWLQPRHSQVSCFVRPVFEFQSVLPVCASREVACLMPWLRHNIFLWGSSFCYISQKESSGFSVIFVIVGVRVVCVTVDFSGIIFGAFNLLFVPHSVHLTCIRRLQTVELLFPLEVCHNLFIRAVLQLGLVYWFLQVWRHLGIYELFNDCLGSNPERIFRQFLEFVQ